MQTHDKPQKSIFVRYALTLAAFIVISTFPACKQPEKTNNDNKVETQQPISVAEDFHADNDIAMTVRSIADAIRVGEPLDSTDDEENQSGEHDDRIEIEDYSGQSEDKKEDDVQDESSEITIKKSWIFCIFL